MVEWEMRGGKEEQRVTGGESSHASRVVWHEEGTEPRAGSST